MANVKISALTADTAPTSDDLVATVTDPAGTPASRKVTLANAITKAHGLSDGIAKVSASVLTTGTVAVADMAATSVVTAAEGLASSDNDTSVPTTAAVIDGLDTKQAADADLTTIAGLTATTDNFIQSKAAAWDSRTPTQVTADLIAMVGDTGTGGTKGLVPAPGTGDTAAGKFLKADGNWTVPAGGGQTVVTRVVAASGGDHTTLGAAITASSAGDTIWIKNGAYAEGAITTSLADISIIGANPEKTVLTFSGAVSITGANVTVQGIKFIMGANNFTMSTGAGQRLLNCNFTMSSGVINAVKSDYGLMQGNRFIGSSSVAASIDIQGGNKNVRIVNNYFELRVANAGELITWNQTNSTFSNNTVYVPAAPGGTGAWLFKCAGSYCTMSGNAFSQNSTSADVPGVTITGGTNSFTGNTLSSLINNGSLKVSNGNNTITGNTIYNPNSAGKAIDIAGSDHIITGNYMQGGGSTSVGITINTTRQRNIISSNRIDTFGTGINIPSSASSILNIISGNAYLNCTTFVTDAGLGTFVGNSPDLTVMDNKQCFYMKNTSGSTVAAGNIVTHKAVAAGDEVTTSTTAGDNKVFGIAQSSTTTGNFGYIQTTGRTTLLTVDGTTDIAIGDFISCFTTVGIGQKALTGHTAIAIALEAYTANDSSGVIDALLIPPRLI
jgi:hypothetical protein